MFRRFTLISLAMLFTVATWAEKVPVQQAEKVAKNVYHQYSSISHADIELSDPFIKYNNNHELYYIFNIENHKGFVIVSADDRALPVIGYSLSGRYGETQQPPQFISWMEGYALQLSEIIDKNLASTPDIDSDWANYTQDASNFKFDKNTKNVNPLLDPIAWDQGSGWNSHCPVDPAGPGGHVYAGCVATAAGMVMKFWEHPAVGEGSSTYYCAPYGTLSANYGESSYDWAAMSDTYWTDEAAFALYHIGISVQMQYGPDGSGAYTSNLVNTFENNFRYLPSTDFQLKDDHPTDWADILMNELDNGRPMVYKGRSDASGGHAFCCDGYSSGGTLFHFNWGWSGYYNGSYTLANLNPGGNNFNEDQGAVIGIEPDLTPIPTNDPPTNLTAEAIDDDVNLTWEAPGGGAGGEEELVYDNDVATGAYYWNGATMATQMTPSAACQVIKLKFYTSGSGVFNAEVYGWTGSEPGSLTYQEENVSVIADTWVEVDISGQNINVTEDFVVGFGSINETASIGYDANLNNGRSWDLDGTWASWTEAYLIRAVVLYPSGKTEELVGKVNPNRNTNLTQVRKTKQANLSNSVKPIDNLAIKNPKSLEGFQVYRDGSAIGSQLGSDVTEYTDMGLSNGTYTYYVTAVYTTGESDPSNEVTAEVSANVEEITTNMEVYPNPAADVLHVNFINNESFMINFRDVTGRIVYKVEGEGAQNELNISHLNKGIYFIEVVSDNENFTKRIVKK